MNKINLKGKIIGGFCALSGVFILTLPIPIVVNSFAPFYKNRLWRNEVIIIIINIIIIIIIIILRSPLFAPFYKNGLWRNEVPALKLSITKKTNALKLRWSRRRKSTSRRWLRTDGWPRSFSSSRSNFITLNLLVPSPF